MVERLVYTQEVGGSKPSPPTNVEHEATPQPTWIVTSADRSGQPLLSIASQVVAPAAWIFAVPARRATNHAL